MSVVRCTLPVASISEDALRTFLRWDGSHHVIYANNAQSTMQVRQEGDQVVLETAADAPLDSLKSHLRYMIVWGLGGTEATEA
ncbi:MAG: hypothetical protein HYX52_04245 [Chloroflexi bacterium]|nr:hypothetical protein [Chloroflexota bacterium]